MTMYERIHERMGYGDDLVQKAREGVLKVYQGYRSWGYGYHVAGSFTAGLVLSLMPKFMIDNPEMFCIPEGLDAKSVEDAPAGDSGTFGETVSAYSAPAFGGELGA